MKKSLILIYVSIVANSIAYSQQTDTAKTITLKEVTIRVSKSLGEMERMPDLKENVIYAGKKNGSHTVE